MSTPGEPDWIPQGDQQEIPKSRWEAASQRFDTAYQYAVKSQTHLWIVTLIHTATDQTLDAFDGRGDSSPILDADTIAAAPAVGCFVCEEPYDPRFRLRRCPGEPRRGGR